MIPIISLDIETTGLDPKTDSIIEIGAVLFSGQRIEHQFSTLINPNRHIPEFITGLTGIDDAMVRQAPHISDVLDELSNFVKNAPILGHNIKFDLSFFHKLGLFTKNQKIDTYDLAAVLLPSASRYNLQSLCILLGIPMAEHHRALNDALATHSLFLKLYPRLLELPEELLAEINHHGENLDWDGNWAFQQAHQNKTNQLTTPEPSPVLQKRTANTQQKHSPINRAVKENEKNPIQVPDEFTPIDIEEAAAILEHGGLFSKHIEMYEYRPEQVEMLKAVANALSIGQHLMVEAGTGIGKSFAYLIPAAIFALQNNTRILISTNTINLQDQLIGKDIPELCAAMGINLRAAVLKGRSNYLCPRRLDLLRRRGPATADEIRVLAKILVWTLFDQSGDRNALNLTGPAERDVWNHLSADDTTCSGENCQERQDGACPFYRAKLAAVNAHILVVNHALLLTDVAVGNRVLPDYQHVIIDEGHHLEAATTGALSFHLSAWDIDHIIKEVGSSKSGILGSILAATRDHVRPSDFAAIDNKVERATDLAWRFQEQCRGFFEALTEFINTHQEGKPNKQYTYQERILPASHAQPGWDSIEISWSAASETLHLLIKIISELQHGTADLYADGIDDLEEIITNLGIVYRQLSEAENMINAMIFEPSTDYVYWVEISPAVKKVSMNAAPIRVGGLVQKYLWHEKRSVILTSATLTTHGEFDYIRNTLSADEADELSLGSPFDYETAALLYIANDVGEPNSGEYQRQVEQTLIALCKASGGRTLVLFTSYAQLRRTARAITAPLTQSDILIFEQGDGASPNALLESFKSSERAVLLGTRSFWEGVDIPGEALSILVMVKLPFDVPSDPLIAARSETYEDPFYEYQLPEAILRFRQGFGRLIRTQSDRGIVVILDRRVLTKPYGKYFLESLPRCTLTVGSLTNIPKSVTKWLNI